MQEQSDEYQKKESLFLKQKELLDTFLSRNAIDRRQYNKSLNCLREKLGLAGAVQSTRRSL